VQFWVDPHKVDPHKLILIVSLYNALSTFRTDEIIVLEYVDCIFDQIQEIWLNLILYKWLTDILLSELFISCTLNNAIGRCI